MLDRNTVKLEVLDATKEVVDGLLAVNSNNRSLSKDHVKKLRRNIANGQWIYNLEVIEVLTDKDGKWKCLVSGQHRLAALRDEGYPKGVVLNVISGYDPEGVAELSLAADVGKSRKGQDVLKIIGAKNASQTNAAINIYVRNMLLIKNFSVPECAKFYKDNESLNGVGWDWLTKGMDGVRPNQGFYGAVLADIMEGHVDAAMMYEKVLSDTGWTKSDTMSNPLYRLRQVVSQTFRMHGPKSIGINDCLFVVARKCFDFARNGKPMKKSLVPGGFTGILNRGVITKEDVKKYTAKPTWDPADVECVYPVDNKKNQQEEDAQA